MSGLFESIVSEKMTAQRKRASIEEKKAAVIRRVAAEYRDLFSGVNKTEFRILFSSVSPDIKGALSRGGVKDKTAHGVVRTLLERYAQETIPTTEPDGNVQPSVAGDKETADDSDTAEPFSDSEEDQIESEEEAVSEEGGEADGEKTAKRVAQEFPPKEEGEELVVDEVVEDKAESDDELAPGDEIQIADETGNTDNPITVTVVEVLAEGIKVRLDKATENSQPGEYMIHEDAVIGGEPVEDEESENPFEKSAGASVYGGISDGFDALVEEGLGIVSQGTLSNGKEYFVFLKESAAKVIPGNLLGGYDSFFVYVPDTGEVYGYIDMDDMLQEIQGDLRMGKSAQSYDFLPVGTKFVFKSDQYGDTELTVTDRTEDSVTAETDEAGPLYLEGSVLDFRDMFGMGKIQIKTARDWVYSMPFNSTIQAWHDKYLDGVVSEDEMVLGMLTDVVPLLEKHIDALRLRNDPMIDEQMLQGLEDAHGRFFYLLQDVRSGLVESALEEFEQIQDDLYNWGDFNSISLMGWG